MHLTTANLRVSGSVAPRQDVCVHTTMRDANDMGYECLLLSDCTAATCKSNHLAALDMVKKQVGGCGPRGLGLGGWGAWGRCWGLLA